MDMNRLVAPAITILFASALSACVSHYETTEKVNVVYDENNETAVYPPKCPDWTGGNSSARPFDTQKESSNYGCATVNNYGQMVADPLDMISGKSTDSYDPQATANAVAAYHSGQVATTTEAAE